MKNKFIDLFAGIGGFRLGFERAGLNAFLVQKLMNTQEKCIQQILILFSEAILLK